MLVRTVHLLLGTCGEDEAGSKLLHIAGMRTSNGQSGINRDMPIVVRRKDGAIGEAVAEPRLL